MLILTEKTLSNGLVLAVHDNEDEIDIVTAEKDGTVNQVLLSVAPAKDGESFTVLMYGSDEDEPDEYTIDMHHDPDEEEYEEETETSYNLNQDTDFFPIGYGDRGDDVKMVQERLKALGYFTGAIGGNYLTKTENAVKAFQLDSGLQVDGICDNATFTMLFDRDAVSKVPDKNADDDSEPSDRQHPKIMDWWTSDIQKIFAKGVTATITDLDTGLSWQEQRRGGTNHADVQPLTKEDTAKLKKAYGGKWSWNRRAIVVTINGQHYAASMNGMPHGGSSIKGNGFDGHHCIHFTSSRTHCSDSVCPKHQAAIRRAAESWI